MKTKKHTNNLQKSSVIFLPLGLVLTMLTVYGLLESKTALATVIPKQVQFDKIDPNDFAQAVEIEIERPKVEEPKETVLKEKSKDLENFITTENPDFVEEVRPFIEKEVAKNPSDELVDVNEKEELEDDSHLMMDFVDEIPIYPGCEKVSISERRNCFEEKIKKLVQRKFNVDLAYSLGLTSGKKRITVKFVITKNGDIEILGSRSTHVKLEKEGERIVKLIPKMKPGKVQGRNVNVSYMLPITFQVE